MTDNLTIEITSKEGFRLGERFRIMFDSQEGDNISYYCPRAEINLVGNKGFFELIVVNKNPIQNGCKIMTDKYTYMDAVNILIGDIIPEFSDHREYSGINITSFQAAKLMNQAYEEGKKDGAKIHRPTCCCVKENDALKKENDVLKDKIAYWENFGQRIIYNPIETEDIIFHLEKENKDLKEELQHYNKISLDRMLEKNEVLKEENETLKEENETLKETIKDIKAISKLSLSAAFRGRR